MIDTDKYEGHYTDDFVRFWVTADDKLNADIERAMATAYLIQDAPLLLAEVKRLTDIIADYRRFHTWVSEKHYEVIEEWDFLEGVREGYEVIEEWEGEQE